MSRNPATFYANVVNIRLTPGEFVLEFGTHFPDKPGPPPSDFKHDVRVVMQPAALQGLLDALAQGQRQQQQQQMARRPVSGFQGPAEKDKKDTH